MKKLLLAVALFASVTLARAEYFHIGLNSTNNTDGFLSGLFEAPANNSTANGGEVGIGIGYETATRVLDFNVAYGLFGFEPLTSDYLASHIHRAPVGVAGPVEINLAPLHVAVGTRAGMYSGTLTLTEDQQNALFNQQLYVNVHSTTFPDGEIRGQLVPVIPEPSIYALAGLGIAAFIVLRRRV
jgi:hypothetical protein